MRLNSQHWLILGAMCCVLAVASSCGLQPHRAHPSFDARIKQMNSRGLILCDVKVYESIKGGPSWIRNDWCEAARTNLLDALSVVFGEKNFQFKAPPAGGELEAELREIQQLYRVVNRSIQTHTYGPYVFPDKIKSFEYSVGSIEKVLQKHGSNFLVFISGYTRIAPDGQPIMGALSTAVADATGDIIWHCVKGPRSSYDFRASQKTAAAVKEVLGSFPEYGG